MLLPFSDLRLTCGERKLLRKIRDAGINGIDRDPSDSLDRLIEHGLVSWVVGVKYSIEPRGVDYLAYHKFAAWRTVWRVLGSVIPIVISLISLAKSYEVELTPILRWLGLLQ